MISWSRRGLSLRHLAAVLLAGGLGALGCGSKAQPEPTPSSEPQVSAVQAATARKVDVDTQPKSIGSAATGIKGPALPRTDPMHQPFSEATLGPDSPPPDSKPPVDQ